VIAIIRSWLPCCYRAGQSQGQGLRAGLRNKNKQLVLAMNMYFTITETTCLAQLGKQ